MAGRVTSLASPAGPLVPPLPLGGAARRTGGAGRRRSINPLRFGVGRVQLTQTSDSTYATMDEQVEQLARRILQRSNG